MEGSGADTDGNEFKNAKEMWMEQVGDTTKRTQWYREGVGYWQGVEASVNGVLGGYGHVSDGDIFGSEVFLKSILAERFPLAGKDRPLLALGMSVYIHFLIFLNSRFLFMTCFQYMLYFFSYNLVFFYFYSYSSLFSLCI